MLTVGTKVKYLPWNKTMKVIYHEGNNERDVYCQYFEGVIDKYGFFPVKKLEEVK